MRTATILAVSTTLLLGLVQDLAMGQELPGQVPASAGIRTDNSVGTASGTVGWRPRSRHTAASQIINGIPVYEAPLPEEAYVEAPAIGVADPCDYPGAVMPCMPQCRLTDSNWRFFGDYLWLQTGDASTAYAVRTNGAIVPPANVAPLQLGPVATVDPGAASGFRVGLSWSPWAAVGRFGASYAHFESSAASSLSVDPPDVNDPLVIHPGTESALPTFLDATGRGRIAFDLGDIDYRTPLTLGDSYLVDLVLGARYAHLEQDFHATYFDSGTIEDVNSTIRFDGGGLRVGLEGERISHNTGFLVYGRAGASFVAGNFTATYSQVDNFSGTLVDTSLSRRRIVPILDMELGVGWTGPQERLRLTAGYMVNAWYNVLTTSEYIQAVQNNRFAGLSNTVTFDGLVARAELRF